MKASMMFIVTVALAAVVGCSLSNRGGGVSKDEGFTIAVPSVDTELKQGEMQTVTVSLHRGESFKRDVKLQIKASKGISVEPSRVYGRGRRQARCAAPDCGCHRCGHRRVSGLRTRDTCSRGADLRGLHGEGCRSVAWGRQVRSGGRRGLHAARCRFTHCAMHGAQPSNG